MRRAALLLLPLALGGCPSPPPIHQVLAIPSLPQTLGPAWTMVPLPNTKLTPGAIVQINPVDAPTLAAAKSVDLVWLGTLGDCAVPPAVIGVTTGAVPGIATGSSYAFNADLGAKLAHVSLDASASASGTASIKIDESSDASLNYISFSNWVASPVHAKGFNAACGAVLARPAVYVIEEAFIISKGSYAFARSSGGKIAVTPPPNVPVTAEVDATGGPTGNLTITAPVVFALKTMQLLPSGGFEVATLHHATHHGLVALAAGPSPPAGLSPLAGKSVAAVKQLPGS